MNSAERSDITNAIWLCRNCHKLVDGDSTRYPHELLYEWRREHEEHIQSLLGKAGARLRKKAAERLLDEFKDETYLSQQIILDKPAAWEYRLTGELLRAKIAPVMSRWRSLSKSLYSRPVTRIAPDNVMEWWSDRVHELTAITPAFSSLMNGEFQASWGEPGEPGSATEILRVSNLFVENCQALLEWEERVRFVRLPERFERLQSVLIGVGGTVLDQLALVPAETSRIFSQNDVEGEFVVSVSLELPDGWVERCEAVMAELLVESHDPAFWD